MTSRLNLQASPPDYTCTHHLRASLYHTCQLVHIASECMCTCVYHVFLGSLSYTFSLHVMPRVSWQVVGFLVLLSGTLVYNQIVPLPCGGVEDARHEAWPEARHGEPALREEEESLLAPCQSEDEQA